MKYGSDTDLKFIETASIPELLAISPVSLSDFRNVHENTKQVVVDVHCGASIFRGAHIFAPGVLAMTKTLKINDEIDVFADLDGKCKKGTNFYESDNKLFLGQGRVKQQRYQLYGENVKSQGIAVEMDQVISGVPCLGDSYLLPSNGILQNLPSIICSRVLNPLPSDIVLDMCASPGNKTTHLIELKRDQGVLIALDKSNQKIIPIVEKVQKLSYNCANVFAFDSTKCVDLSLMDKPPQEGPPFSKNTFDKILLDAPCSSIGNRPQLSNRISKKMLDSFPVVQKQLFFAAVNGLKTGGVLVYSTCSVTIAENEDIVCWALTKFTCLELVPIESEFGGPGARNASLNENQRAMVKRFGPPISEEGSDNLLHDSVGFFIAKFRKIC